MKIHPAGFYTFCLLLCALLLFGCSPNSQVFSDYDRTANLEEYHTFGWLAAADIEALNNPLYYNELNDKRIKNAVGTQLENRNYKFSNTPELLMHYHIVVDDKTVLRTDPYGYYYGPYWMQTHMNLYEYQEGTLIIDLMDADTNSLVWRGWVTAFLKNNDPEKFDESITRAVAMIFAKYPYRASNSEPEINN